MIVEVKKMTFVNLDQIDWFGKSRSGICFSRGSEDTDFKMDEETSEACIKRIVYELSNNNLKFLDLTDITRE